MKSRTSDHFIYLSILFNNFKLFNLKQNFKVVNKKKNLNTKIPMNLLLLTKKF